MLQLIKIHTSVESLDLVTCDKLLSEFVSFTLPLLNPTNYIFRFNENHLAILWPEKVFQEVLSNFQLVFEEITRKRPWVDGQVEKALVYCGVAQFPTMGESGSHLIENARKAPNMTGFRRAGCFQR